MTCEKNKTLSLFVGWLNIVVSIALPIGYMVFYITQYPNVFKLENHFQDYVILVICLLCGLLPWLILSFLMVKGIKENRPKLMAPWIYLSSLLLIMGFLYMMYIFTAVSMWAGVLIGFSECWQVAAVVAFLTFCFIPVRKLYINMCAPPEVPTTECNVQVQQPDDDKRYMPIFDN